MSDAKAAGKPVRTDTRAFNCHELTPSAPAKHMEASSPSPAAAKAPAKSKDDN